MKILMLAPEPFFQPRGTPISVYFRLKALSDLGHSVDLVTYPRGADVPFPGLTIKRVPNLPGINPSKIGPSFVKLPLDAQIFFSAFGKLVRNRYDLIFSHEEAAFLGVLLGKMFRTPHLYDMHSSLPQQLDNFNFSRSSLLKSAFLRMERRILKGSRSVIVICRDLLDYVRGLGFGEKAVFLENILDFNDFDPAPPGPEAIASARREISAYGEKIVLYTGNFESYQGVPLLIESFGRMKERAILLIVGGSKTDHDPARKRAAELGFADRIVLVEKVPPQRVPVYIGLSDVLVSPRVSGTNTPLKIYAYLKSGKPIVATDLWTNSQVLTEEIAVLAPPEPEKFGAALDFALISEEARRRARAGAEMAAREYTYPRYQEKITEAIERAARR
ncbi:MAG: glycosyltransferase [Candidatus Aminicenantes bacterium]|nr:glycosyltransferase [Candidatus Aminicenantes bacterium]